MKTLYILRHGKSDWQADYARDHDRPLAKRGRKASTRAGRFLKATDQVPDLVVCSSATRARQTLERAARKGKWPERPLFVTDALYEADVDQIYDIVRALDDAHESVMLVGHEPTWSDLAVSLIGGGRLEIPTGVLVRIDIGVDAWSDVQPGRGALVLMLPPRWVPKWK